MPDSISSQLKAVEAELIRLMALTETELEDAASFPTITDAPRIKSEAARLGVALRTTHDVLSVLRPILDAIEIEEMESREAHVKDSLAHRTDKPFAEPAKALLGLIKTTAKKGITDRREIASSRRGVPVGSMRKEQKRIANELAAHLFMGGQQVASKETVASDAAAMPLLQQASEDILLSARLSQADTRRLAVELVVAHRQFYEAIAELHRMLDSPGTDPSLIDDYPLFPGLYVIAEGGGSLDGALLFSLPDHLEERETPAFSLPDQLEEREAPALRNRFCWLARVLRTLRFLPGFSGREGDILVYAHSQAEGNLHVFLEVIEQTQVGRSLLEMWTNAMRPREGHPPVSEQHFLWTAGLASAELLVHPDALDELAQKDIGEYVLSKGGDRDRMQIADLNESGGQTPWWQIEDTQEDRELLRELNSSPIDSRTTAVTLRRLFYK